MDEIQLVELRGQFINLLREVRGFSLADLMQTASPSKLNRYNTDRAMFLERLVSQSKSSAPPVATPGVTRAEIDTWSRWMLRIVESEIENITKS